jgi:hypothetical protein
VRKGMNRVEEIPLKDQIVLKSFEDIKKAASAHFVDLYSKKGPIDLSLRDKALSFIPQMVSKRENEELTKRVSEEEIFSTIMQFESDKAPGPDGFSTHFYKKMLAHH